MPEITLNKIITFLVYPPFEGWLLVVKLVFIGVTVGFLIVIIYYFLTTTYLERLFWRDLIEFLTRRHYETRKFEKRWDKAQAKARSSSESARKLGVIEADDMLEEVLKKIGYPGKNLGERLEKMSSQDLSNLELARKAHDTREDIVHDPSYRLGSSEAQKLMKIYGEALKELEAF